MSSVSFSDDERVALKESLEVYLTDLKRETAHTEAQGMQHALAERQRHLEAILTRL